MALLLTAAQMRAVDGAIIGRLGLPGLVLMENAGRGVAEIIARERPTLAGLAVRVVCGAGQNGGDGFVLARHLLARGADVRVLLALPAAKIVGDAAVFASVLRALKPEAIVDLSAEARGETWRQHLDGAAVIVDALFGTGLRAEITGVPGVAIAAINASQALRVAVDIPSGLDADDGQPHGSAVQAHITATMGARKLGLVLDAEAPVGRIEVVDLGVAPESVAAAALAVGPLCHWLEAAEVARGLPAHGPAGHKGNKGHLLVIAGSVGKTGAALLAGRAALRTGAGLATIATTAAGQAALDAKVLAEMTACYTESESAAADSYARLVALAARMKAAVLGPGIPTGEGMAELVSRLAVELPLPLVIDADGLNLLGERAAASLARASSPRVLTPHPGEMAHLCGTTIVEIQRDRLGAARRLAAATQAVVVLKGARTIIATPDGTAFVNPAANPALGTAGSGDVLTGAIGALLAQGLDAATAATVGVFVHGMAAEVAARALGGSHLVASDLPDAIARACADLRAC
jgi:ADP-dependent NAD(P)H-hydrate dehydratase / NAD(P)H-hydrate epimerase